MRTQLVLCAAASTSPYARFDWTAHFYPVAWVRDLPAGAPSRVTLFDEDYAVVLREGGLSPLAMRDVCPHRLAALSEGRLTQQGWLQCAYHGWAFDEDGECKAVPQVDTRAGMGALCATAVEAVVSQGMLWICPSPKGSLTELPPVPIVPEMDDPEYKYTPVVRDLPIDYSILVENILDPDHGLFAHQMPGFDLYTATREDPQLVTITDAPMLRIESRVPAKPKLVEKGAESMTAAQKMSSVPSAATPLLIGTSSFTPPACIVTGRRDEEGRSSFLTCFFLSPTGVGRTRFMSAAVGKAPIRPPRWLVHIFLNRFLDQDTYLLATQQPHVLRAEYDWAVRSGFVPALGSSSTGDDAATAKTRTAPPLRRCMYKYRSPTERLLLEVGKFLDASLPYCPSRYKEARHFHATCPPREVVLNRHSQHTAVCQDSQDAVQRLRGVRNVAWFVALVLAVRRVAQLPLELWPSVPAIDGAFFFSYLNNGPIAATTTAAICMSRVVSVMASWILKVARTCALPATLAAVGYAAHVTMREFRFSFSERDRDVCMSRVPSVYSDGRLEQ